jgi:folate-binding protein YgfZ
MPISNLERAVFELEGDGVEDFLAGLITNSLKSDLSFAALLTPQGKIIADFFVHRHAKDHVLIETAPKFSRTLLMRLKMYKLRAKFDLTDVSDDYTLSVLWGGKGDMGHVDPRLSPLGQRYLSTQAVEPTHTPQDYDLHRMALGVPDSEWDFETEKVFPADVNMDQLGGVDYKKGCFIGQEVVSRMHRKTQVRKRMRAVKLGGDAKTGDELKAGGRVVGTLFHVRSDLGMALIRLDRLAKATDDVCVNQHIVTILEPPYDTQS